MTGHLHHRLGHDLA